MPTLIRLNTHHPEGAKENVDKSIAFTEDMAEVMTMMSQTPDY